jgi:hypothetical protein
LYGFENIFDLQIKNFYATQKLKGFAKVWVLSLFFSFVRLLRCSGTNDTWASASQTIRTFAMKKNMRMKVIYQGSEMLKLSKSVLHVASRSLPGQDLRRASRRASSFG